MRSKSRLGRGGRALVICAGFKLDGQEKGRWLDC